MFNKIIEKIEEFDTIIIHGHKNPDFDCLGSQFGLKYSIEATYPNKKVQVVNEKSENFVWGTPNVIEDDIFKGALSIIVDVSNADRTYDDRFKLSDYVIVIDHHKNDADFGDLVLIDPIYAACAETIAHLIKDTNLVMTDKSATSLLSGIITDTGQLRYSSVTVRTLEMYAYLIANGAKAEQIHRVLGAESLKVKRAKGYFLSNFKLTEKNVAYMINDDKVIQNLGLDFFTVSRGMVNTMGNIPNVPFWLNFTEDISINKVVCEFRSASVPIVQIAKKYGGGGHDLACGCSLDSFDDVQSVLDDFDKLASEVE